MFLAIEAKKYESKFWDVSKGMCWNLPIQIRPWSLMYTGKYVSSILFLHPFNLDFRFNKLSSMAVPYLPSVVAKNMLFSYLFFF